MRDDTLSKISLILFGLSFILLTYSMAWQYSLTYPHNSRDKVFFSFLWSGTPDEYGNQIRNVSVYQDTSGGGSWELRGNLTHLTYDADDDITGILNQTTRFDVWVRLNYTLADSIEEAGIDSMIYVSITGEFSKLEASYVSAYAKGTNYYEILYRYDWDRPDDSKTYDVRLEYYVSGATGNPTNLDEGDPTEERFWNTYELALALYNPIRPYPDWDEDQYYSMVEGWGGVWGYFGGASSTGYFYKTDFRPLHGKSAFTVVVWFIPDNLGSEQALVSEYVSSLARVEIHLDSSDGIYFLVGDGTYLASLHMTGVIYEYNLTCAILAWDNGDNGGKVTGYVNSSSGESSTGTAYTSGCYDHFYVGARDGSSLYFDGWFASLQIYNRKVGGTEASAIFNGGIGYVDDGTGLQNSWSFDEYYSGLYTPTETTLHDGLGVYTESEQWDIDFVSQTVASYSFFWWGDYPNEYIWLVAVAGFIASPCLMVWVFKRDEDLPTKLYFMALLFVVMLSCFSIMYGMTPTP